MAKNDPDDLRRSKDQFSKQKTYFERVSAKMILSMTNDAQRVDCKKRNVKTK